MVAVYVTARTAGKVPSATFLSAIAKCLIAISTGNACVAPASVYPAGRVHSASNVSTNINSISNFL